ncbi:DNA mismatch repair protein MutS [Novipirellula aureliae]|uniref:DNA mismatch repair protein MutS n=1 Tax=Novipirellula aureliae TaxID=2527966 RepID=A0A5C6DY23_9BACT|nr:MutS family DNA mismatch repair protein [Novipirellula aureliae]TWU41154.1 DNA mismatch repair protein MutS [Novipirellula aureliae]
MNASNATPKTDVGDASEALHRYRQDLHRLESERAQLKSRDRQFGSARVVLFLLAIVFLVLGTDIGGMPPVWPIGWLMVIGFLIAVVLNEPVRERIESLRNERSVLRRLIARIERDWDRLSTDKMERKLAELDLSADQRDVASDLDLLGRASLFHLLSMTATTPGIRTLASWLTQPAIAEQAIRRREAIEALAPLRDERLRFYKLSRKVAESSGSPDRFTEWAIGEAWLEKRNWLSIWANLSVVLAVLFVLAIMGGALQLLSVDFVKIGLFGIVGLGVVNVLLTAVVLGPAHAIFSVAMSSRGAVAEYVELFHSAAWLPEEKPLEKDTVQPHKEGLATDIPRADSRLSQLRETLLTNDRAAVKGMQSLQKVASAGALRQSAATFLLYLPLQAFALWDVRVLRKLESWQAQYRDVVHDWFEALGEFESLMSIAALRDEYPNWAVPSWKANPKQNLPSGSVLEASALGHPLLGDSNRVTNDVSVGPSGTLLLVTGSNMSGKSTMLRSIGLNVALAGTGAPVCASAFALPSMELATSIRVSDNLSQGVSFYMAELHRLKQVVEHARRLSEKQDRVLLFLLDEILQGTNSRERQIAVVQVLRHLINLKAIGAISTHDLELADEPELNSIAHTVHFRETILKDKEGNDTMTFDYRMQQGVSPTTNALRLLEMVGL